MKHSRRFGSRGFTVVERPVAVGAIAVLPAVLRPMLSQACERAHQTVCSSDEHRVFLTIENYVGQENGTAAMLANAHSAKMVGRDDTGRENNLGCNQLPKNMRVPMTRERLQVNAA